MAAAEMKTMTRGREAYAPPADPCPKNADGHKPESWVKLGQKDDGRWAWRCGNCLEVRMSMTEEGGPDPIVGKLGGAASAGEV